MSSMMEERGALNRPGLGHSVHQPVALTTSAAVAHHAGPAASPVTHPWRISVARAGDHHLACQLLANVQQAPSAAEFQAQLDDPYYEPTDRLLGLLGNRLIAHTRLIKREMQFGGEVVPLAQLADMLVLPEFRGGGCGSALLAAAESEMKRDGAQLGLIKTKQPQFFLRRGWCVWSRQCYSVASAREILSRLLDLQVSQGSGEAEEIQIRWCRHIELSGLMRLYEAQTQGSYGPLVRSESYWQWLLSRHGFDRIYVAVRGAEHVELERAAASLVGYAVMREGRIVELMTDPACPGSAEQLLARVCADVIEQNGHYVRLDAPPEDPLHQLFASARGERTCHEMVHGEACLVKLLDKEQWLESLVGRLHALAKEAGLNLPLDLGLRVEGCEAYCLQLRSRGVRWQRTLPRSARGKPTCGTLTLGRGEFQQLLLGHLDVESAVAAGRIRASSRAATAIAAKLFPALPLWRFPWDEFAAR